MGSCQARAHTHKCSPSLLRCYPALCAHAAPPARVICRPVGWELKIFVVIPKIIAECGSPNVCGYSQVRQQHRQLAAGPLTAAVILTSARCCSAFLFKYPSGWSELTFSRVRTPSVGAGGTCFPVGGTTGTGTSHTHVSRDATTHRHHQPRADLAARKSVSNKIVSVSARHYNTICNTKIITLLSLS